MKSYKLNGSWSNSHPLIQTFLSRDSVTRLCEASTTRDMFSSQSWLSDSIFGIFSSNSDWWGTPTKQLPAQVQTLAPSSELDGGGLNWVQALLYELSVCQCENHQGQMASVSGRGPYVRGNCVKPQTSPAAHGRSHFTGHHFCGPKYSKALRLDSSDHHQDTLATWGTQGEITGSETQALNTRSEYRVWSRGLKQAEITGSENRVWSPFPQHKV